MKKIKSIKHLQAEKKRIQQQQEFLEQKIRNKWNDLKESMKPANLVTEGLNCSIKNKIKDHLDSDSVLKNTFTYGFTLLANNLLSKAGDKISKVFKK